MGNRRCWPQSGRLFQGVQAVWSRRTGASRIGRLINALLPRPELTQQHGFIHAGALTTVVDSACGYAAMTVAPAGHDVLTVEFKVNFLRPASADRFVAVGKVKKAGRTLTVCEGEVVAERGSKRDTIAVMLATIINVPARD